MAFIPKPIALQNDEFRRHLGIDPHPTFRGVYHITRAISALPLVEQHNLFTSIREFNSFDDGNFDDVPYDTKKDPKHSDYEGNDAYLEHDFGAVGEYCFKIDYWTNEELEYGPEDPADPEQTYRVMTIMRLEDW